MKPPAIVSAIAIILLASTGVIGLANATFSCGGPFDGACNFTNNFVSFNGTLIALNQSQSSYSGRATRSTTSTRPSRATASCHSPSCLTAWWCWQSHTQT